MEIILWIDDHSQIHPGFFLQYHCPQPVQMVWQKRKLHGAYAGTKGKVS
jgi:hypothetical protein